MPVSLRETLQRAYPGMSLAAGIRGGLLHRFWREHPGMGPYRSLRAIAEGVRFPSSATFVGDDPSAATTDWSTEAQGVSHDGESWYFSSARYLLKIASNGDIAGTSVWAAPNYDLTPGIRLVYRHKSQFGGSLFDVPLMCMVYPPEFPDILKGMQHFGDLDFNGGLVYVPVTEPGLPFLRDPKYWNAPSEELEAARLRGEWETLPDRDRRVMAVFDRDLRWLGGFELKPDANGEPIGGSWCAVNPIDGRLYISPWFEISDPRPTVIHVLEVDRTAWTYRHVDTFELYDRAGKPSRVRAIQGGSFSTRGHLYLLSDERVDLESKHTSPNSGIYGFDMVTGRQRLHCFVAYVGGDEGWEYEEVEGLAVWDRTGNPRYSGQLHVLMLDNDSEGTGTDDIYFKHYAVPEHERGDL